jgi:hypothetical protein
MITSALGQNLLWGRVCDHYKLRVLLVVMGETIAGFAYIAAFLVHRALVDHENAFAAGLAIILDCQFWNSFGPCPTLVGRHYSQMSQLTKYEEESLEH